MNAGTQWLETASHGLIVALGAWLLWVKAIRPWVAAPRAPGATCTMRPAAVVMCRLCR